MRFQSVKWVFFGTHTKKNRKQKKWREKKEKEKEEHTHTHTHTKKKKKKTDLSLFSLSGFCVSSRVDFIFSFFLFEFYHTHFLVLETFLCFFYRGGGVSKIGVFKNTTGFRAREGIMGNGGDVKEETYGAERPTTAAAANDDDAERPRDFDEYDTSKKRWLPRTRSTRRCGRTTRDAEKKRRGRSIGREGNDGRLRSERKFALVDARSAIGRVVSRSESAMEPGG